MRQHADAAGLTDTVIVNTCAVTQEAVRQAMQTIRRLRRDKPNARIVVTGCAAQIDPKQFSDMSDVDHVIGNAEKLERTTFQALSIDASERVRVNDIMSVRETANHLITGFGSRARAYVQVQNGCDHRCTFCIIPFGRGPSRSVPAGGVVDQVRQLVEAGYAEIVLTGVDMTSYGADLPGTPKLGTLVRQVLRHVPDLKRLRLSSIDQVEADPELMRVLRDDERLMPHLHLSMQSGDDLILKRMKRRHLRRDAIAFCEEARRLRPDIVFGADLIAGFPTESEEMFANTCDIVDACGLTYLHVFPFSPRSGTPAARMPQHPRDVVKDRAARLRSAGQARILAFLKSQVGNHSEVLMETEHRGRTPQFAPVMVDAAQAPGSPLTVRVTGLNGDQLTATPATSEVLS
ncbi:MAG: tRNA (N(6)-L-threonylcarbamoyladenosine(37)-C(2))-methylthiotransferase MtaB [Pseudomonadota bacterium]